MRTLWWSAAFSFSLVGCDNRSSLPFVAPPAMDRSTTSRQMARIRIRERRGIRFERSSMRWTWRPIPVISSECAPEPISGGSTSPPMVPPATHRAGKLSSRAPVYFRRRRKIAEAGSNLRSQPRAIYRIRGRKPRRHLAAAERRDLRRGIWRRPWGRRQLHSRREARGS